MQHLLQRNDATLTKLFFNYSLINYCMYIKWSRLKIKKKLLLNEESWK